MAGETGATNVTINGRFLTAPRLGDMTLALFGSPTPADLQAVGLPVPENVVFLGRVSDETLGGLMESVLCLAFSPTTEVFGPPPLEAMHVGCPASIAPLGAFPKVCGPAAPRAATDDPASWAAAIGSLRDPALFELDAGHGREWSNAFIWRRAAQIVVDARRREAEPKRPRVPSGAPVSRAG